MGQSSKIGCWVCTITTVAVRCYISYWYLLVAYIHTHTHTYIQGAQGTLSLSKNCTSRESVSPLSRLIRGFRNKYH